MERNGMEMEMEMKSKLERKQKTYNNQIYNQQCETVA